MRIAIGSDTKRAEMKDFVTHYISQLCDVEDMGTGNYADVARRVTEAVAHGVYDRGVLICRTGIGMAMAANKIPGAYAANCRDAESAVESRRINDTNILAMGEMPPDRALEIVSAWLSAEFSGEERYLNEIRKIRDIEVEYSGKTTSC
jgi:RpiB/LacA/LacB family sugar-phosphate isomerase